MVVKKGNKKAPAFERLFRLEAKTRYASTSLYRSVMRSTPASRPVSSDRQISLANLSTRAVNNLERAMSTLSRMADSKPKRKTTFLDLVCACDEYAVPLLIPLDNFTNKPPPASHTTRGQQKNTTPSASKATPTLMATSTPSLRKKCLGLPPSKSKTPLHAQ